MSVHACMHVCVCIKFLVWFVKSQLFFCHDVCHVQFEQVTGDDLCAYHPLLSHKVFHSTSFALTAKCFISKLDVLLTFSVHNMRFFFLFFFSFF